MVHHLHQYSMTIFCTTLQHSNMACRKALQRWSHASHVEKCDFQWPLIPRIQALAFRHPTCMLESHHAYMWFTHWNRMNQRCPLKLWMFHCIGFLEELPIVLLTHHCWLVVYLRLWKMMEFVSWDHYSQYMEKWKMFQTTNQYISLTIINHY